MDTEKYAGDFVHLFNIIYNFIKRIGEEPDEDTRNLVGIISYKTFKNIPPSERYRFSGLNEKLLDLKRSGYWKPSEEDIRPDDPVTRDEYFKKNSMSIDSIF